MRLLSPFTHALTDNHLSVQYLQWIHIVYGVFSYWESSNSHTHVQNAEDGGEYLFVIGVVFQLPYNKY